MTLLLLIVATFVLGIVLGLSGYGGFLVPPLLVALYGYDPRTAVALALLAGVVPALLGAHLYHRAHRTPRSLVLWLCAGSVPGIVLGRLASAVVPDRWLQVLIGLAVLVAGIALVLRQLRQHQRRTAAPGTPQPEGRLAAAAAGGGFLGGVAAVVVGVGGPLVTTPILVSRGIALGPAVGAGMANAVVVSVLGAASLLDQVTLDPVVLLGTAVPQLVGIVAGVRLRPYIGATFLTRVVSVVAVATGIVFITQAVR
jgi:uncharacterized membrane protein YfcA